WRCSPESSARPVRTWRCAPGTGTTWTTSLIRRTATLPSSCSGCRSQLWWAAGCSAGHRPPSPVAGSNDVRTPVRPSHGALRCPVGDDLAERHPSTGAQDRTPVDGGGKSRHRGDARQGDERGQGELPPRDRAEPDEGGHGEGRGRRQIRKHLEVGGWWVAST